MSKSNIVVTFKVKTPKNLNRKLDGLKNVFSNDKMNKVLSKFSKLFSVPSSPYQLLQCQKEERCARLRMYLGAHTANRYISKFEYICRSSPRSREMGYLDFECLISKTINRAIIGYSYKVDRAIRKMVNNANISYSDVSCAINSLKK